MPKSRFSIELDPDDPFDRLLIPIVEMNRKKRADYTHGDDIYSNFREVAEQMNITPLAVCDTLVAVKQARLKALAINETEPTNESLQDTYLDRAVYAVLSLGLSLEEAEDNE